MIRLWLITALLTMITPKAGTGTISGKNCDFIKTESFLIRNLSIDSIDMIHEGTLIQYMTVSEFKKVLGRWESGGIYQIENKYGFKGKYQFSNYMIGRFAYVSPDDFLRYDLIQEQAMTRVIMHYTWYLQRYGYTKYINKKIGGTVVTMEGLMLGMHFSPSYLRDWLETDGRTNKSDGYITIGAYIKRFENKGIVVTSSVLYCN